MPKGNAAHLPVGGHRRPKVLHGLVVTHVNEKGDKSAQYDFATLPISARLRQQFAELVAERVRPVGSWRSLHTSQEYWLMIGVLSRWLEKNERLVTCIEDFDVATWLRWKASRRSTPGGLRPLRIIASLLENHPNLPAATRREMQRRLPRDTPSEVSYSDAELKILTDHARRIFGQAERRIAMHVDHLAKYRSGVFAEETDDHRLGQVLDTLASTGDVPYLRDSATGQRKLSESMSRLLGGKTPEHTWKRLFLDSGEAMAVIVLLVCEQGWNFTTVQELRAPTVINVDEHPVYYVQLEKRRRRPPHRYETRTLDDNGPQSPGRLLTRILAATAPARALREAAEEPTDRLIVFRIKYLTEAETVSEFVRDDVMRGAKKRWETATGTSVNFRRVRKTVNVRYQRRPNQNTQDTHDSAYVLSDPSTFAESETDIARGIEKAIDRARKVQAKVANRNDIDVEDTATAGCADNFHSPFSPWGVSCSASFLLCLACTNAVVMPRHLGRLAYLHECLTQLRGSLPSVVWVREWAEHYDRLHNLYTEHYTSAQWSKALSELSDSDRSLVDSLLKGDLDS